MTSQNPPLEAARAAERLLPFCGPMCGGCTIYKSKEDVAACHAELPDDWNGRCAYGSHYANREG